MATADRAATANDAAPAAAGTAPLQIIVCWHRESSGAPGLARFLYTQFARDPIQPESRGIGAPLYFHVLGDDRTASSLRLDDARRSVVVLLVDDALVADDAADELLEALLIPCRERAGTRVITVALSRNAGHLRELKRDQHVRYFEWADDQAPRHLVLELAHAFAMHLSPEALRPDGGVPPRIRVFLSHAKRDGVPIAESLRVFLQRKTGLGDFFDVHDLAPGHAFEKGLEDGVASAALLVIQTDAYGSREWCQKEVLWAKKHRRPIVVVNAVHTREVRMFPYLGNVPSVRWAAPADGALDTAHAITVEVFRAALFEAQDWVRLFDGGVQVLSRPPELATLQPDGDETVLYPDPPLADDEVKLLASFAPRKTFVTPISRRRRGHAKALALVGKRIGLSVSESQDAAQFGLSELHLQDAVIELARHLLAAGAMLVYGGDLRNEGFTRQLFALVRDHNAAGSDPFDRIENFLSWPDCEAVDARLKAEHKPDARFVPVTLPDELVVGRESWADDERDWRRAFGLSLMRQRLAERCDARVVLGGKVRGYAGLYPGIAEEAYFTLKAGRPLFVAGGFGGCAAELLRLREAVASELESELLAPPAIVLRRRQMCTMSTAVFSGTTEASVVIDTFRASGEWNPLTSDQRAGLGRSRNVAEIVELVLAGLGA